MSNTRRPLPPWMSFFGAASLLFFALMPFTSVEAQSVDEAKVKAAFVLRFVQFIDWPSAAVPPANAPLTIAVAGADAIAAELSQMTSTRSGQDRPLNVRPVKAGDDLAAVHVLVIGREDAARIGQYVSALRGRPVLIVTESASALDHGSMINFVIAERRVRFEIALDAAEKAGLVVSSRLLAVAVRVHKGELPHSTILALIRQVAKL